MRHSFYISSGRAVSSRKAASIGSKTFEPKQPDTRIPFVWTNMGLLGERPEVTIDRDEDPRLLCLDDEYTEEVLKQLSSETSQAVFRAVNQEPLSAQDVARELDMSIQNAMYHLENLEETGLITVLDTHYSERGREIEIYGPTDQPLLLFLGPSQDWSGLTAAFKEFAGAVGPVAIPLAIGQFLSRLLGSEN